MLYSVLNYGQPLSRTAIAEAWKGGEQGAVGREARVVLSYCLQVVLPLLLIKEEGGSQIYLTEWLHLTTVEITRLQCQKTSAGSFNRSCSGLYGGEGPPSYPNTLDDLFSL